MQRPRPEPDTERAEDGAQQLAAIDADWNCPWPLDWQRHYRVLADLSDGDGPLPDIQPGVLFDGDDLGKWLERQQRASNWAQLSTEQQERLTGLGVKPAEEPSPPPAAKSAARVRARRRRPSSATCRPSPSTSHGKAPTCRFARAPRTDRGGGQKEPVQYRFGVWLSNTKSRRDKLTAEQRATLADLGLEWA